MVCCTITQERHKNGLNQFQFGKCIDSIHDGSQFSCLSKKNNVSNRLKALFKVFTFFELLFRQIDIANKLNYR